MTKCKFECLHTSCGVCEYTMRPCEEIKDCAYRDQCRHCDNKLDCKENEKE